jgi:hypothetical protein
MPVIIDTLHSRFARVKVDAIGIIASEDVCMYHPTRSVTLIAGSIPMRDSRAAQ